MFNVKLPLKSKVHYKNRYTVILKKGKSVSYFDNTIGYCGKRQSCSDIY